jgi:mono/diheme cytochrome c family protein
MGFRRQVAWDIVFRTVDPVPLLGLAEEVDDGNIELPEGAVPKVARFQTWYGVDDFKRMFYHLYGGLTSAERALRIPFSAQQVQDAIQWNATAIERSERWPLQRFLDHVQKLGVCPEGMAADECAKSIQSNFSGATAGNARITYSPGAMTHLLSNYDSMLQCTETLDNLALDQPANPPGDNFTHCFRNEFPQSAVLMKAHWIRSDFGRTMPGFHTDAQNLAVVTNPSNSGDWAEGDFQADPGTDKILTIRLKNGDTYRLAGLHIMTKELRHWMWITLWWSDTPKDDFGADRPKDFNNLDPVWSNYKMGVVVDYKEGDSNPAQWFADQPTLADALIAVQHEQSWLSNPYIEHGRGNARTNCIGCHQHGGSTVGYDLDSDGSLDPFDLEMVIQNDALYPFNGRSEIRAVFPADYLWSTQRVDNISDVIVRGVENFELQDKLVGEARVQKILQLNGFYSEGQKIFSSNCTTCHGSDGNGTPSGPSLFERVPTLTEQALVETLINGKNQMPEWSHFTDEEVAHVRAFVQAEFGK